MPSPRPSLDEYWIAETLRLRECLWGPLQDAMEVRQARTQAQGFTQKVLLRARLVALGQGDVPLTLEYFPESRLLRAQAEADAELV